MSQIKITKPYSALSSLLGFGSVSSRPLEKAVSTPVNVAVTAIDSPKLPVKSEPNPTLNGNSSERLCLLFPSYAMRSSKDPLSDWTLRIKGRAFNRTSPSRSFKLAHGMARRMIGSNRDAQELASLEQRLGFFFDSNTIDLTLNVEVVGLTSPGPMVLDCGKPFAEEPEELTGEENFPFHKQVKTLKVSQSNEGLPQLSHSNSTSNSSFLTTPSGSFISGSPSDSLEPKHTSKVEVKNGHFNSSIDISHQVVERWCSNSRLHPQKRKTIVVQAFDEDSTLPVFGQIQLIEPEGVSIISDIDDTIKDSGVFRGKKHVLRSTFLQECREVSGMSQIYQDWAEKGASFHYVSNSPWELFPMLETFFQTFSFPMGSSHLKLWDLNHKALFYDPMAAKRTSIQHLLEDFPNRKFIMVGDSGELDLELYTSLAREYPSQIIKIFIRDVTSTKYPEFIKMKQSFLTSRLLSPSTRNLFGSPVSLSVPNSTTSSRQNSWSDSSHWKTFKNNSKENPSTTEVNQQSYVTPQSSFSKSSSPISILNNSRSSSYSSTSNLHVDSSFDDSSSVASIQLERNPDYLTACSKLQKRLNKATLGLPADLVSLFSSPTTLYDCPIVKNHLSTPPTE